LSRTQANGQAGGTPDFKMEKNIFNPWVEISAHEEESEKKYFANILNLPTDDKFRQSVEEGQIDWFQNQSVLALYEEPNGKRLPLNYIPCYGVASVKIIGINYVQQSRGWKNIIEFITSAKVGDKLEIVFYTPWEKKLTTITKTEEGFVFEGHDWSGENFSTTDLLSALMGEGCQGRGGCPVPAYLAEYFKGIPNVLCTKGYLQKYSAEVYTKKAFARECGDKARANNLPFEFLLKMNGNIEGVKTLVEGLEKINSIANTDVSAFHVPFFLRGVLEKYGINISLIDPKKISNLIFKYLQDQGKITPGFSFQKISVKNPKSESQILSKGSFFKTEKGLLISRTEGRTCRRVHQGGNDWNLFNVEGIFPNKSDEKKGHLVNFGRYGGEDTNISFLYENDLIPINISEWEKLAGREFRIKNEFCWFTASICRRNDIWEMPGAYYGEDFDGIELNHENGGLSKEGEFSLVYTNGEFSIFQRKDRMGYSFPINTTHKIINGIEYVFAKSTKTEFSNNERWIIFGCIKPKVYFKPTWVGYETHENPRTDLQNILQAMQRKIAYFGQDGINKLLGRRGHSSFFEEAINFFKEKELFSAKPEDSRAVGNCALGTWRWMKENLPAMPDFEGNVSWENFPVSVKKMIRIPVKDVEDLAKKNHLLKSLVVYVYRKENFTDSLSSDDVCKIFFSNKEKVIGSLLSEAQYSTLLNCITAILV